MSVGVAITTTPGRAHFLEQALAAWGNVKGVDLLHVNVDHDRQGVAASKNACLAALMDWRGPSGEKVDHLFLLDDDTWPAVADPLTPYIDDELPHLMFCWGRSRRLADNGTHTTWRHPRGVMLYVEREVVEDVGGMRTEFGRGGSEHVEWSRRIHQAGWTPSPYTDLTISPTLWHAEDMGRPGESSNDLAARRRAHSSLGGYEPWQVRAALMDKYDGDTEFVEYRA